jgi:phosphoenolpyruvate---glycerone phosphotransferase subunit DhaL
MPARGPAVTNLADTWLLRAAERVHEEAGLLTALDQAIGDGDHGSNLDRGFRAVAAAITTAADAGGGSNPDDVESASGSLRRAGRTLISTVGGASGPLYGTALLRAAGAIQAAGPGVVPGARLVAALSAAVEGVAALGRSAPGEKTMLDAMAPAAEAARKGLDGGLDLAGIARAAASAAEHGAAATIPMLATKGRASYLGPRSIGHQDPGATSTALLLGVLAETLAA